LNGFIASTGRAFSLGKNTKNFILVIQRRISEPVLNTLVWSFVPLKQGISRQK